ncbi:MAG TPA: hypothetical protein VKA48_04715 [Gammaproteobacteria bacterium]|nr:hypothetical protein [Gammaproteobacteria bacterium]
MSPESEQLLEKKLAAAELGANRLAHSLDRLSGGLPIEASRLATQDDGDLIEAIDAFIKRFEQLQDLLANRLFRGIALFEQEEVSNLSRRDPALLMEKLGVIPSAEEWARLAILRNQLTQEYPGEPESRPIV